MYFQFQYATRSIYLMCEEIKLERRKRREIQITWLICSVGFGSGSLMTGDVSVDTKLVEIVPSCWSSSEEVASGKMAVVVGSIWSSSSKKMMVDPVTTFFTESEWCAVVSNAFMYPASSKLGAIDSVTTFSTMWDREETVVDVSPSAPAWG